MNRRPQANQYAGIPAPQNGIRQNIQPPLPPPQQQSIVNNGTITSHRSNVSELVTVPDELLSFASEPSFQTILLKVKEQTLINYITLNRISNNEVDSIIIDAPTMESGKLARNLIETHFKLQLKLRAAENRLHKIQSDLYSTQGEIASGMMIEFHISPELIGLALGKKGARIKQIEKDTKVTSVNVNGETGRIMIVGPDSASVQQARELLELQEESLPLEPYQVDWLSSRFNSSTLNDIKTVSDLIVARVSKENNSLDIVGTVPAVRSAKFMIGTQLEYVDKQIEIEAMERESRNRLYDMRKQYGLRNEGRNSAGGGRGGRGDGPARNSGGNGMAAAAAAHANEVRRRATADASSNNDKNKAALEAMKDNIESQGKKDTKSGKSSGKQDSVDVSAVTKAMKDASVSNKKDSNNTPPSDNKTNTSNRRRKGAVEKNNETVSSKETEVKNTQEPLPRRERSRGKTNNNKATTETETDAPAKPDVKKIDFEYSTDGKPKKVSKTAAVSKATTNTTAPETSSAPASDTAPKLRRGGRGGRGNGGRGSGGRGSAGGSDIVGMTLKDAMKKTSASSTTQN